MRKLDRRQFAQEASLAFLAGVTVTLSSCGGGGAGGGDDGYGPTTSTPPTTTPAGSKTGSVTANHGHTATITAAQLAAGGALQLNIAGDAGHPHIVDLPAQAVQEIRDGRKVQKESTTTDAHVHMVTFNAEAAEEPSRY